MDIEWRIGQEADLCVRISEVSNLFNNVRELYYNVYWPNTIGCTFRH